MLEFNAPPAEAVLSILAEKAQAIPELMLHLEAAQWQAIAVIQKKQAEAERAPEQEVIPLDVDQAGDEQ